MTYVIIIVSSIFLGCSAVMIAVLMINQLLMLVTLLTHISLNNRSDFKRINTEILRLSQLETLKLLENYLLVVFREINPVIFSPIEDQT